MRLKKVDCDSGERREVLKILLEVLKFARESIGDSSEACMTRFGGLFFMMACALFLDLYLVPEKIITGRWGTVQVDYLVESRNTMDASMVGVVEAKKGTTLESGFPQNVAQLGGDSFQPNEARLSTQRQASEFAEFVDYKMKAAAAMGNDNRLVVKKAILPVAVN